MLLLITLFSKFLSCDIINSFFVFLFNLSFPSLHCATPPPPPSLGLLLQDFKPLQGHNDVSLWIYNATKDDEGIYTCTCTWTHNHKVYKSSGSRRLVDMGERAFSGFFNKPLVGVVVYTFYRKSQ